MSDLQKVLRDTLTYLDMCREHGSLPNPALLDAAIRKAIALGASPIVRCPAEVKNQLARCCDVTAKAREFIAGTRALSDHDVVELASFVVAFHQLHQQRNPSA